MSLCFVTHARHLVATVQLSKHWCPFCCCTTLGWFCSITRQLAEVHVQCEDHVCAVLASPCCFFMRHDQQSLWNFPSMRGCCRQTMLQQTMSALQVFGAHRPRFTNSAGQHAKAQPLIRHKCLCRSTKAHIKKQYKVSKRTDQAVSKLWSPYNLSTARNGSRAYYFATEKIC